MTDREIFEGLKRDDRTVVQHVYKQYYRGIHRFVSENGGGKEDALDVFQDSVVALYVKIREGSYEPMEGGRLGTYLQAIGKNVWRAKRRKKNKLRVVALEETPLPVEEEERRDDLLPGRVDALQSAFQELGAPCRRLLRLFYFEKLSLRRIAALMTFTEKNGKE